MISYQGLEYVNEIWSKRQENFVENTRKLRNNSGKTMQKRRSNFKLLTLLKL